MGYDVGRLSITIIQAELDLGRELNVETTGGLSNDPPSELLERLVIWSIASREPVTYVPVLCDTHVSAARLDA